MKNVVEIKNLTKTYGKHRGISNVNLEVQEGDIFGFLGPNGAGKSTAIRSMLGFLKYNEGTIRILGNDAPKSQEEILRNVGYMPSEALFYPRMKVKEIIKFAAQARGLNCDEEAKMLCRRLQVDVEKRISDLSLGNRKKVSIVCAMQHKPKLFVFDEPTSGLDPLMQSVFFELIEEHVAEGATCILSTHVLSEVKNHCKNVAIMKEGKLICVDTVENLTAGGAKRVKYKTGNEDENFIFKGNINDLVKDLGVKDLEDLIIEEPSLDEIFMHYYENGAN